MTATLAHHLNSSKNFNNERRIAMLELKEVGKKFKKKLVLNNVNFTFEKGVYGLLGPNGAGKTTLMRCITKLYPLDNGKIHFNNYDIEKSSDFLCHVGYLPQNFGVFKDLTVKEMMLLMANLKGIGEKQALPLMERSLEIVNLSDRIKSRTGTLSGGMIRRIGIAQAILGEPEIIIFDEPTAGLDPEERLRFKNIIAEISEEKTIIISTHIVEDVEAVCDFVAVMKNSTIAESDTCSNISARANGKVFCVPEKDAALLEGDYTVQKHFEQDGEKCFKVLSSKTQKYPTMQPSVEDGYICILKDI